MCRRISVAVAVAVVSVLTTACGTAGTATERTGDAARPQLLGGGRPAFEKRLASLRSEPVVVNQWASWCGPCRFEFGFFGSMARRFRGEVTFIGVDAKDSREDAEAFLRDHPVPFEHFFDPDLEIARSFRGGRSWPTTAFYGRGGRLVYTHYGAYKDAGQLEADIRRYALDG